MSFWAAPTELNCSQSLEADTFSNDAKSRLVQKKALMLGRVRAGGEEATEDEIVPDSITDSV